MTFLFLFWLLRITSVLHEPPMCFRFFSPSHLPFRRPWPKCGISVSGRDSDVLCEWNVPRKGLKADQMPPPLTFLPVVYLCSYEPCHDHLSLSLSLGSFRFLAFCPQSLPWVLRWFAALSSRDSQSIQGCAGQPKPKIPSSENPARGKIESVMNFKVQRSRARVDGLQSPIGHVNDVSSFGRRFVSQPVAIS